MIKLLQSTRLKLRPIEQHDTGVRFKLLSNPSEIHLFGCDPHPNLPTAAKQVLGFMSMNKQGFSYHWTIELKDKPSPQIGFCDVYLPAPHLLGMKICEIAYGLCPQYRDRGYMNEALTECIAYLIQHEGFYRIEASVNGENSSSIKLLEKLGFRKEGIQRKKWLWGKKRHDMILYSLLADEFIPAIVPPSKGATTYSTALETSAT